MLIYAGVDEAGYGPMFGPLVVGRFTLAIEDHAHGHGPPDFWRILSKAVCRDLKSARRGRIAVNDSKKLHTSGRGVGALEMGVLAFAALAGKQPERVDHWLDDLGETCHRDLASMPWYAPSDDRPWAPLPHALTSGQVAVARGMLAAAAKSAGVTVVDLGADIVLEDRFNRMVAATRSKASTSFTFVADHLQKTWDRFGEHHPTVVVDRQSGRTHYRRLLSLPFADADLTIVREDDAASEYLLESAARGRAMTVRFEVDADSHHMPVALASMISKYTRELLMMRFQAWFAERAPAVKPTAGYATDAKRFWQQIQPTLAQLSIQPDQLRRMS